MAGRHQSPAEIARQQRRPDNLFPLISPFFRRPWLHKAAIRWRISAVNSRCRHAGRSRHISTGRGGQGGCRSQADTQRRKFTPDQRASPPPDRTPLLRTAAGSTGRRARRSVSDGDSGGGGGRARLSAAVNRPDRRRRRVVTSQPGRRSSGRVPRCLFYASHVKTAAPAAGAARRPAGV